MLVAQPVLPGLVTLSQRAGDGVLYHDMQDTCRAS